MNVAIFGAGMYGRQALTLLSHKYSNVEKVIFLDNDIKKNNTTMCGKEIILPQVFKENYNSLEWKIIIAAKVDYIGEIKKQLMDMKIDNIEVFDASKWGEKGRIISYSHSESMEDVILYHIFKDEKEEIFYIDIGSNDPFESSVTKLIYDMKNASGINVEPQKGLCDITRLERPRDICINACVGKKKGSATLYLQNERSTVERKNIVNDKCETETVDVLTLKEICDTWVKNKSISFIKIDVEGNEEDVINGADFEKYRPKVLCIEGDEKNCINWEKVILDKNYRFVKQIGENRWYVAEKNKELAERIISKEQVLSNYHVCHAVLMNE